MILRLVDYFKLGFFHADKILSAEFSIVPNLGDLEALVSHILKPLHDFGMVYGRAVRHRQPAVILPAESGMLSSSAFRCARTIGKKACVIRMSIPL